MKTKKRSLFLITAVCCLGVGAVIFSNLNPISAIYADNISYGMTFNSSKNKFHNYSGATPYSGEATVKTNLGNNINFEYKDLMGLSNTWHVAKTGGYFTNLDPINGLEKINVSFKTNNINYKIYWSYTTTFDEKNVYSGTSSTSSPLNFNFNSSFPTYFKFENSGATNLNIGEINFEFTCLNGTPTINVASNDETLGTVSGGGTFIYGESVTLVATPNIGAEFVGWYENDALVSKDNPYTFNTVNNRNIIGKFAIKTYQVKVDYDSMMGSVFGIGSYSYGDTVTLKASPNDGYSFFGWYKNNKMLSQDNSLSFIMEDHDICYEARFVKNYKLFLYSDNEELGIVEGPSEWGAGLKVSVNARSIKEGYFVHYWYDSNLNEVCYDETYTFTMPNNDVYLYVCFEEGIKVDVINNNDNYVTVYGEGVYKKGGSFTLEVEFDVGEFIGWYKGGELISKAKTLMYSSKESIELEVRWHNLEVRYNSAGDIDILSCPQDIKHVYIPTSPKSVEIGTNAFKGCANMISVTFPKKIYYINTGAFSGCYSLENIYYDGTIEDWCNMQLFRWGSSVINPMYYADHFYMSNEFNDWYEVTEIVIPDTVTKIGRRTFYGFDKITSITIPDSVTFIGDYAFELCYSLTNVYYKGTIEDWCNISFSSWYSNPMWYAKHFYMLNEYNEWYEVTEIVIPDSVTFIGYYVFEDFYFLTNVYYKGTIEDWCNITFSGSDSNPMYYADHFYMLNEYNEWYEVTEIVIPDTVTKIGNYQFSGFENVTSITIPNSVTSIGNYAFYYCSSLTSITIPNSVTSIGNYAFEYCFSLTNVYYSGTIEDWCNISFVGYSSNPMCYAEHFYMLNESNEWYEVKEIIIPDTVTEIGDYQFFGFDNITSIIIPNSVTSIGNEAFWYCKSLTSITIPDSVTSIGSEAFYNCSSLKNVYYSGTIEEWNSISLGYNWKPSNLKTITCNDGIINL